MKYDPKTRFRTKVESTYGEEFVEFARNYKGCVQGELKRFPKVMRENMGFNRGLTKYGGDEKGLERRNPLIVVLGDSVTAGHFEFIAESRADFPRYIEAGLPVEVVDERVSYPEIFRDRLSDLYDSTSVSVINAGIAGGNILGMEERLTRDVISHDPDLVILNGSLNWGVGEEQLAIYTAALERVIKRMKAETDADIVLLTPNMMDPAIATEESVEALEQRVAVIREMAPRLGVCLADAYKVWKDFVGDRFAPGELLANGQNHPTMAGHRVYAEVLLHLLTV
ncbi:MAG: hypothetical protein II795_00455 [Firmicutes bacterium]|nr:hypothetical protein [Bacillota bacterium]